MMHQDQVGKCRILHLNWQIKLLNQIHCSRDRQNLSVIMFHKTKEIGLNLKTRHTYFVTIKTQQTHF